MQKLYLLGFTQDLKGVVFSERRGGRAATFWIPVDDAFLGAIDKLGRARQDRTAPKSKAAAAEPVEQRKFSPAVGRSEPSSRIPASEIQQLLREGRTIESVTKVAKANRAWIERLAEPVDTERQGVIRLAQRAHMPRSRLGRSGLPLGQAIRKNLDDRKATTATIEALDDGWEARATRAGPWRIRLKFTHRGSRRVAEWDYVKSTGQLTARNRLATELGWTEPPEEPKRPKSDEEGEDEEEAPRPAVRPVVRPVVRPAVRPRMERSEPTRRARPRPKPRRKTRSRSGRSRTR